jgi:acyl carrier protein
MKREEILLELQDIFREVFIDDALVLTDDTTASDIDEWDSLMQVTLISEIENKYNREFSLEEVSNLRNVGDMVDLIMKGF